MREMKQHGIPPHIQDFKLFRVCPLLPILFFLYFFCLLPLPFTSPVSFYLLLYLLLMYFCRKLQRRSSQNYIMRLGNYVIGHFLKVSIIQECGEKNKGSKNQTFVTLYIFIFLSYLCKRKCKIRMRT